MERHVGFKSGEAVDETEITWMYRTELNTDN